MRYSLQVKKQGDSQQQNKQEATLKKISPGSQQQIVSIKHFPNLYQQQLSYFIVISTKQDTTDKRKIMRIRRVFYKQSDQDDKNKEKTLTRAVYEIQCSVSKQGSDSLDFGRVIAGNFINENAIVVMSDPFELYFLTKQSLTPIKIILEQPHNLRDVIAYFSSQSNEQQKGKQPLCLIVYGFESQSLQNKLFSINLLTFDVRQVAQAKQYSPKARTNQFRMFHDGRLYVFGGQSTNNKQIQQLLWSFDLEKGYWFALEMEYKQLVQRFNKFIHTMYDSGKVILAKQGMLYLLEIYQCKITEVQYKDQNIVGCLLQQQKPIGMFTFQKILWFYTEKQIIKTYFELQKPSRNASLKKMEQKEQSGN